MNPIQSVNPQTAGLLVGIPGLMEALFGDECNQPSKRWIQYQMARRTIPYIKVSGKTFFDVAMVRAALEKNCLITAETGRRARRSSRNANSFKHTSEATQEAAANTTFEG